VVVAIPGYNTAELQRQESICVIDWNDAVIGMMWRLIKAPEVVSCGDARPGGGV
jgi:hypothetical protein